MSEDQEALLLRIGQLAGQINRHKNQHEQSTATYGSTYQSLRGRGAPYWQPSSSSRGRFHSVRGRGRGRGGVPITHHHRTLVLSSSNNKNTSSNTATGIDVPPNEPQPVSTDAAMDNVEPASAAGWVAKRDRHIQLINTAVYKQQVQSRVKAMAKTQEERVKRKEAREHLKFNQFLQSSQNAAGIPEVVVGGERFRVIGGGSKLVRLTDDSSGAGHTPKRPIIGGVQYQRSRNGNLWRAGLVKASRLKTQLPKSTEPCKFYSNTGQCKHGLSCPFVHNPNEVAICPQFLASDSCPNGDMCDLSHEPSPHRVPACHHFQRGNCSNSNCRYGHVRVNPAAPVCRAFATLGYCSLGANCRSRHVHECPEFDQTGECTDKKCKLPHIQHAGRRRAAAAAGTAPEKDRSEIYVGEGFTSSEEEGEDDARSLNSDDVDSDILSDVDFITKQEDGDGDTYMTRDFIKF